MVADGLPLRFSRSQSNFLPQPVGLIVVPGPTVCSQFLGPFVIVPGHQEPPAWGSSLSERAASRMTPASTAVSVAAVVSTTVSIGVP